MVPTQLHCSVFPHNDINQECKNPRQLSFVWLYLIFAIELASCHLTGTQLTEVAPRFLENVWNPRTKPQHAHKLTTRLVMKNWRKWKNSQAVRCWFLLVIVPRCSVEIVSVSWPFSDVTLFLCCSSTTWEDSVPTRVSWNKHCRQQ